MYQVIRNGYLLSFFDTYKEAEEYIEGMIQYVQRECYIEEVR